MHRNTVTGLEMRSLIMGSGELEISLARVEVSEPADDEVVVRVQASPINPSDLGITVGTADMAQAILSGTGENIVVKAPVSQASLRSMAGRLDKSMPVGNEGAGIP